METKTRGTDRTKSDENGDDDKERLGERQIEKETDGRGQVNEMERNREGEGLVAIESEKTLVIIKILATHHNPSC